MRSKIAIYLDSNAGAPLHPRVKSALFAFLGSDDTAGTQGAPAPALPVLPALIDSLVNPSSTHQLGRKTQQLINQAADQVAKSFGTGVKSEQILWNSCGTEANQQVIRSVLAEAGEGLGKRPHWITTSVEHSATRHMVEWWMAQGGDVSVLPVNRDGLIDQTLFADAFRAETALVSLIWANNETGVVQPIDQLIKIARAKTKSSKLALKVHLDGAQVWGKFPLHRSQGLAAVDADFVTFAAHKIGAPAGCGVTYLRDPKAFKQDLVIGNQQRGKRGGTENVIGMVMTGVAAAAITELFTEENAAVVSHARETFEARLLAEVPGAVVHGAGAERLCNTTSVGLGEVRGMPLVPILDMDGICVSAGSACSSGIPKPSAVLLAMGVEDELALSTIRVSLLPAHFARNQKEDLDALLKSLTRLSKRK